MLQNPSNPKPCRFDTVYAPMGPHGPPKSWNWRLCGRVSPSGVCVSSLDSYHNGERWPILNTGNPEPCIIKKSPMGPLGPPRSWTRCLCGRVSPSGVCVSTLGSYHNGARWPILNTGSPEPCIIIKYECGLLGSALPQHSQATSPLAISPCPCFPCPAACATR